MTDTRPHYVYRAYAADDRLLYVGCTSEPRGRLAYHQKHSPWWPFHARITFEPHEGREAGRAAEVAAIASEHPRWNVEHRSPEHPDGFMNHARGRFSAPWLRDEIRAWRIWLRGGGSRDVAA